MYIHSSWQITACRCSAGTLLLPQEQGRTLRAEDASWDDDVIPDLKILTLRAILSTWKDNPVLQDLPTCVDRDVLVETLPTDLPFELTITRIDNDFYWQRAAKDRWDSYRSSIIRGTVTQCDCTTIGISDYVRRYEIISINPADGSTTIQPSTAARGGDYIASVIWLNIWKLWKPATSRLRERSARSWWLSWITTYTS